MAVEVQQTLSEARPGVSEDENVVAVACPHPGCERTANATAPDVETEITVTRSAALFGDYEKAHCSAGHKVFVHYCAALDTPGRATTTARQ